jgi:ribose-phosphate pyrophosphokinase
MRATELADILGVDFALIHKNRANAGTSEEDILVLVGNVEGRDAIIMDDMADTCVTLTQGAALLKRKGARKIYASISHGIFSGDSIASVEASDIAEIIVSNTVPQQEHQRISDKFRVFDISPILAEAIRRTHNGESISYLFNPDAFQ